MLTNVFKTDTSITIATQMQPVLIQMVRLPVLATQATRATVLTVPMLTNVYQTLSSTTPVTQMLPAPTTMEVSPVPAIKGIQEMAHFA
jgi:methionine synthase II (cobalamin-independent)